jgi:hypothetical protein
MKERNKPGLVKVLIRAGYLLSFSLNSARVILSADMVVILELSVSSFLPKMLVLTEAIVRSIQTGFLAIPRQFFREVRLLLN